MTYLVGQFPSFDKYKYQILTWASKDRRCLPADDLASKGTVTIDDHYRNKHEIQQVPNDKSIRELGYEMTPLGNQE